MKGMSIPALSKLVSECWVRAEQKLRESVKTKFPDRDEEILTDLFHAELAIEFQTVSATGAVANAFLRDLRNSLPNISDRILSKIADGLIATVTFHPKSVEEKTGGDFGIVIVRPDVRRALYVGSELTINHDYRRGLLCQAKVFRRNSSWGGLSSSQRKVLPTRLSYLSLVLYRYSDQRSDRRELEPFQWQLAQNATVAEIDKWLHADDFPSLQDSGRILSALARDLIGTDDKEIIAEFITPPMRPSLEINIHWRDGDGPGDKVRTYESFTAEQATISVRRS